jgi:stage II sporulation protein AA (anti-sigma F factor antagonist)
MERADVRISPEGDTVEVSGCADLNSADDLDAAIDSLASSHQRVLVDLDQVTLLDSRIIAVLMSWMSRLRARGGDLPIVCSNPNVHRIFKLMGLDREFEFLRSRPGA